eukprot:3428618-Rhodomonas_salina.2
MSPPHPLLYHHTLSQYRWGTTGKHCRHKQKHSHHKCSHCRHKQKHSHHKCSQFSHKCSHYSHKRRQTAAINRGGARPATEGVPCNNSSLLLLTCPSSPSPPPPPPPPPPPSPPPPPPAPRRLRWAGVERPMGEPGRTIAWISTAFRVGT